MAEETVLVSVAALVLGLCAGCGTKESVLLSARIEDPALTVDATPLTTELTGGFTFVLSVGDRASDPTTVKLGTFSLARNEQVLFDPLELDTTPEFPITVGVGKSKNVDVVVTGSVGDTALAAELCADRVDFVGTVTDTLGDDRPRTVRSGLFPPMCP